MSRIEHSVYKEKINPVTLFRNVIDFAMNRNFAWSIWKSPGSEKVNILLQKKSDIQKAVLSEIGHKKVFVIHPFNQEAQFIHHINADVFFEYSLNEQLILNSDENTESIIASLFEEKNQTPFTFEKTTLKTEQFEKSVNDAVFEIQQGNFKKVVLSRVVQKELKSNFDIAEYLNQLFVAYTQSFVALYHTTDYGTWVTASPEILLSVNNDSVFHTIALAGTQFVSEDKGLSNVVWSQKEIEEQALVSRYIINCFKQIRLREFEEEGPRTVQSGHLYHLRTDFTVDLKSVIYSDLTEVMLRLLHPTSAVCGMPKESATSFILKSEANSRSLFTGFIGAINIDQPVQLYVNLRCGKFEKGSVLLYAGAGITQDSVPEKEFAETAHKMDVIGKYL